MHDRDEAAPPDDLRRIRRYGWKLSAAWTLLVLLGLVWIWHHTRIDTLELASSSARLSLEKDMVYRRWAAMHGGVYVPVTEDTPPNPYLSYVPERDVVTASGRRLTLVNPSYMTRQVLELGQEQCGLRGHITSLEPLRPENAPDAWEAGALRSFETGSREVAAVEEIEGQPFFRLMRPFVVEQPCLKCHSQQGYKLGDIRGGISVSEPMLPFRAHLRSERTRQVAAFGGLWLLGVLVVLRLTSRLSASHREANAVRDRAFAAKLEMEARYSQSQKLESIGTLASGVAHEINNPLYVIMNFGQLILDEQESTETIREYATEIVHESERVANIVRALMAFSGRDQKVFQPASVSDIVQTVLALVGSALREDQIAVETRIGEDVPPVSCNRQEIQQVVMNLVLNAKDALNERYPGASDDKRVTIEVSRLHVDGEEWVRTVVADRGAGIPAPIAGRIFDPFFSTKPKHKGTGIGLSVSRGFVANHVGRLWFESESGQGTRFYLDLRVEGGDTEGKRGRG